jgi:hypothetical protein
MYLAAMGIVGGTENCDAMARFAETTPLVRQPAFLLPYLEQADRARARVHFQRWLREARPGQTTLADIAVTGVVLLGEERDERFLKELLARPMADVAEMARAGLREIDTRRRQPPPTLCPLESSRRARMRFPRVGEP